MSILVSPWRIRHACVCVVGAALALTASRAHAQFARTGAAELTCTLPAVGASPAVPGARCDQNWSLTVFDLDGGVGSPTATLAGTLPNAAIVTSTPSPPWTPNAPGQYQWIGARADATVAPNNGSGQSNYRYFFSTTFVPSAPSLSFGIGWDNRLVGAFLSVGALPIDPTGAYDFVGDPSVTPLLGSALVAGTGVGPTLFSGLSGFCRSDGVFPASNFPDGCVVDVFLASLPTSGATRTLTFVVEGDGATDAFLGGPLNARQPPPGTVPEPGALLLLGTGLAGLAVPAWRRRGRVPPG